MSLVVLSPTDALGLFRVTLGGVTHALLLPPGVDMTHNTTTDALSLRSFDASATGVVLQAVPPLPTTTAS